MGLFIYIEQIFWVHVCIALGGGQTRVTQQFLDRSKIPASLQHVRRKGVTEGVGAGFCAYRSTDEAASHDSSDRPVCKWLPTRPCEDWILS